jgi:hypothetical protein
MPVAIAIIGGLVLIFVLNLLADRVRNRVDVVRVDQRLTVRNQRAALRIDAITFTACVLALVYALVTRSPLLIVIAAAAIAAVGWRFQQARSAPAFTFDRGENLVWRNQESICELSAVSGLALVPGAPLSALVLNYRDHRGQPHQQLIHRAPPQQVTALHTVLTDFLAHG